MPVISTFIGTKIAICALALAASGGGGAAVAAAAGALPTPADSHPIVSPSPSDSESPESDETDGTDAAVGPDVTGPAGFGLCTAYLAGGVADGSVPSDALIAVAGEDGVDAYCELVVATTPGESGSEEHGKPAETGPVAPELPEQSTQGVSHEPAERPGQ